MAYLEFISLMLTWFLYLQNYCRIVYMTVLLRVIVQARRLEFDSAAAVSVTWFHSQRLDNSKLLLNINVKVECGSLRTTKFLALRID